MTRPSAILTIAFLAAAAFIVAAFASPVLHTAALVIA